MSTTLKRHWRILLASMFAVVFVATLVATALDFDNDGMQDDYELMFGLAPATADADGDPDADNLSNLQESLLWTDPFAADTDQDGWTDANDTNPVSRAFSPWGSPFFTQPDGSILYTWPLWMQGAWADGGLWLTNIPYGWHSPVSETNSAALHMELNRADIESNLVLRIDYLDHTNSSLFLDLFDTNDTVTASDLYGNLLSGTGNETNRILELPLAVNLAATGVRLRKGGGVVTILGSLLYVDSDLDGLDADQEAQLGTSDFLADSDADGLSDGDELSFQPSSLNPLSADTDGDGIGDGIELRMGLDPLVAGNYSALPFAEGFEPPAVTAGELSGQNNWEVSIPGVAVVQTNEIFSGLQALKLASGPEEPAFPVIRHLFADAPSVVWLDIRQKVFVTAIPTNIPAFAISFLFDDNGRLIVSDGHRPAGELYVTLTNAPAIPQGEWARISIRLDYAAQTWLVCLNGVLAADNLGFATPQERFTAINIEAERAVMDDMYAGAAQPAGIATVPGNQIPDDWYLLHFGALGASDADDSDADGLTNLQEYQQGTNPMDADTDADGANDAREMAVGSDPLDPLSYPIAMSGTITYAGTQTGTLRLFAQHALGTISNALPLATPYAVSNLISRLDYNVSAFIDTNGDGTPDPWEPIGIYAANPIINPTADLAGIDITLAEDQIIDSDGDSLSDYAEVYTHGSDPTRADTSGDGLPDGWLVQHGFDPRDPGVAARDTDGDGLTNAEEYQFGFDPNDGVADNDGDGLPDGEEIHLFGTSPLLVDTDADGTNDASTVWQAVGTNTTHRNGQWTEVGSTLAALTNRYMRAEYTVQVTSAGMHRLVFNIVNVHAQPADGARFRFQILIDGIPVGWVTSPALSTQVSSLSLPLATPWLTAGDHVVRLAWLDDYAAGKLLGMQSIALQRVDGADNDLSNLADWEEWVLDQNYDTDGDTLTDAFELSFQPSAFIPHPSLNPLSMDTDGDSLTDGEELSLQLSPLSPDSNTNGVADAVLKATRKGAATSYRQVSHITTVWKEDGDSLYNPASGILISYNLTVTNAGMYLLAFDLRNHQSDPPNDYRFQIQISVNDRALSTSYVRADLDRVGTGRFFTPWLTPGTHTISLKWLNDVNAAGRYATIAVDELRLYEFDAPDANGDGIQDWQAAALQSAGDSDGDGISDFLEVTVRGTSPVLKDTDGDGIDDNVEITLGLDPTRVDTDADGVSDWQERNETLTDPLIAEFDGTVITASQVHGADRSSEAGDWVTDQTAAVARYRRGQVEYQMNCPTGDIHRLLIEATHRWLPSTCNSATPVDTSDLLITIDGVYIGKRTLVAPAGIPATIGIFTPWLAPGTHTVRITWENTDRQLQLELRQLTLQRLGGVDTDNNGIRDWVETYLSSMTGLDPVPQESVVSPVCIEGAARYVPLVGVNSSYGTNAPAVNPGIMGRWYSNVPLAPTGTTQLAASFQSGALIKPASVTWTALNLLETTGEFMIRQGDSLKLTAAPSGATNGTVAIGVGETDYTTDVDTPVIVEFPDPGNYMLTGAFAPADGSQPPVPGSMLVRVIAAAFPTNAPACMIGKTRAWACPDIPPEAVLQTDSTVVMSGTTNLSFQMTKVNRDHYVIARLGQNGPVMAHQKLDGFWIQAAIDGYVRVVERQATYQIWEQNLVTKLLPESVDIEISIFIGGVTFADDMTTTRWINSQNLDAIGEYNFQLIHPNSVSASVCHRIKAYENGLYLGEAYYSQILMPDE